MGHTTRCAARSTVVSACLLAALALPVTADAKPSGHAQADDRTATAADRPTRAMQGREAGDGHGQRPGRVDHGRADRAGRADHARPNQSRADTPVAGQGRSRAASDHARRDGGAPSSRQTASATDTRVTAAVSSSGQTTDSAARADADARTGGGPPEHAPAKGKRRAEAAARQLQDAPIPGSDTAGPPVADRPDRPDRVDGRTARDPRPDRDPRAADGRAPSTPVAGPAPASPVAPSSPVPTGGAIPEPRGLTPDTTTTVPPPRGRRGLPDLDLLAPVTSLLEGVERTIDRVAPRVLGPSAEPLARLVPLLLAMLGAFLALQRGIGRGLGHVPMVVTTPLRDPDVRV